MFVIILVYVLIFFLFILYDAELFHFLFFMHYCFLFYFYGFFCLMPCNGKHFELHLFVHKVWLTDKRDGPLYESKSIPSWVDKAVCTSWIKPVTNGRSSSASSNWRILPLAHLMLLSRVSSLRYQHNKMGHYWQNNLYCIKCCIPIKLKKYVKFLQSLYALEHNWLGYDWVNLQTPLLQATRLYKSLVSLHGWFVHLSPIYVSCKVTEIGC